MPRAGAKSEKVAVQRLTRTADVQGGASETWATVGECWAHAAWIRGGESDRQGTVREIAVYRFTVLSAAAEALSLSHSDRLVWNGATYNIRERPRRLPRLVDTEIIAETGVTH